jgi:hypothetical protein
MAIGPQEGGPTNQLAETWDANLVTDRITGIEVECVVALVVALNFTRQEIPANAEVQRQLLASTAPGKYILFRETYW